MNTPPEFQQLENRAFAFYPPILNVEHNEWRLRKATWSEVLVVNVKSNVEVWIPKRMIGELARVDEPLMIVGLVKELEYKAGTVWPHERRLLEMPRMPGPPSTEPSTPAAAPPRTVYSRAESRVGRLIAIAIGSALLGCLLIAIIFRLGPLRTVRYTATDQDYLALSHQDDYFSVVRKLGAPAEDHWRPQSGEMQWRALWYARRAYYVVLFGPDRNDAHYIGAMDRNWHVIHYVELPGGRDTSAMLRSLPKF